MSGPFGRQLALIDDPILTAFLDFHHAHPQVYDRLLALSLEWKAAGHHRIGIATLFEVLRWEHGLRGVRDGEGFRLNNNFRSHYARILMANEARLRGFFETRTLRSTDEVSVA